ncbi:glycosyl transferase [Mediterraneibacter butyricigenes]|uniref:Glycosyl transferase n=1 Tax=Mediterraneibacter butyricigenes TaxID=2316025 RepID=A0A391NZ70_9FIRM|nr:sugar transferase [Mediterraneibacter butyricigenes]RGV96136.1 sugar transferase [Ruminococcus sp. AF14-10]GCA66511.1 glycosyl transferase [Mediterraneibacter butyricigenes]
MLKHWEQLPESMQTEAVRPYYERLRKREGALRRKRLFDLCGSLVLTVLLSPVMLVIAILIKAEDGGPVFFRQERVTTYGRVFRIFKFRTMIVDADKKGPLVTGKADSRITKVGSKLRHLRLDELPQVLNIVTGDMSFVGTRPEVKKYVEQYTEEMKATLLLPAGVTSLASIAFKEEDEMIAHYAELGESTDEAYRNHILPRKMRYNLDYLKKAGVAQDIRIMIKTVLEVIK